MALIETSDLKNWAARRVAQSQLPSVVKSLIYATVRPEKIRIPSGDAVWVPGFDGVVVINADSNPVYPPHVPNGISVWEMGTNDDFRDKATKDFDKRSQTASDDSDPGKILGEFDRSEATFVFVTPLVWADPAKRTKGKPRFPSKDDWVAERKAKGIWKDVRVIDGVELQEWLEFTPSVSLRIAQDINIATQSGLQTADHAWEWWRYLTDPPLSEEVVVAGRGEQEQELLSRLLNPASTFTVRGDSPREALGFVLAVIRRVQPEEDRQKLQARLIIAENETVISQIQNIKGLIILLKQVRDSVSAYPSARGAHLIVPEGAERHSERNVITLARPTHMQFTGALVELGLSEDESERAARESGLSVTILQRRLAPASFAPPSWTTPDHARRLLPALFAGRWNEQSAHDRTILAALARESDYATVVQTLQPFLWMDEPPIQHVDELWTLSAPVDAFQLLARFVTADDLNRFEEVFRTVFGTIDPKVEIPLDEWIYYDVKGERGHSAWLRAGMAETLLLIAERGTHADLTCIPSPGNYAERVVGGISGLDNDWRLLASLRDQYPRLMEAAPRPLLDSLERLLKAKPEDVRRLFAEGGIFSGGPMYTGLLWGLEMLAWSPQYLPRVALILAQLAQIYPGGRSGNRPIDSLRQIFLWWDPGTYASTEQRLGVLDRILAREPDIGWGLLILLLPSTLPAISNPTAKPRWRDFDDLPKGIHPRAGQTQYYIGIVNRVLDRVGSDPKRWQAILESFRALNQAQRDRALDQLAAVAAEQLPDQIKAELWEIVRGFVSQHRTFIDAAWALPDEVLARLEAVLPELAPQNLIEQHRWLFDEWLPSIPVPLSELGTNGMQERQARINDLRRDAIDSVFAELGIAGLVRLGTSCKYPGIVAALSVPLLNIVDAVQTLVIRALPSGDAGTTFAGFVSSQAHEVYGDAWAASVREQAKAHTWPTATTVSLVLWWPDERATWEYVDALGVADEYWRRKPIHVLVSTAEDKAFEIDQLIQAGRAAELLSHLGSDLDDVASPLLLRLLDAALNEIARMTSAEEIQRLPLNSYHIRQYLDQLNQREDIPREERARREYRALPLLGPIAPHDLALHELIRDDPQFFVVVLSDVFLPTHRDKSIEQESSLEAQARARTGYLLLEGMTKLPGQRSATEIDEEALINWITAVREQAALADRVAIADERIGQLLAHAPSDPEDGGWPHRVVRNVLEALAASDVSDIEDGLVIGRNNLRGAYSKSLYEGGVQERELAAQYRLWVVTSQTRWPRVANMLERIAQIWDEHAKREDAWAEQRKFTD